MRIAARQQHCIAAGKGEGFAGVRFELEVAGGYEMEAGVFRCVETDAAGR